MKTRTWILCASLCAALLLGTAGCGQQPKTDEGSAPTEAQAYVDKVNELCDTVYDQEQLAIRAYADSPRDVDPAEAIDAYLTPIQKAVDEIGQLDAPAQFEDAQRNFSAFSEDFDKLMDVFTPILKDGADPDALMAAAQQNAGQLIGAVTHLQAALNKYQDAGGTLPESLQKLSDDIEYASKQIVADNFLL